jgi:hypothetical protein
MTVIFPSLQGLKRLRFVLALLLPVICGCSTGSVFTPYPAQTSGVIRQLEHGQPVDSKKVFGRRVRGRDRILYLMEQGRLAQIQGDWATSKEAFANAIGAIREMDERAVVSMTDLAGKGSSFLLNDNTIPYSADGYERVMLHHGQALNYLFTGDLEGAAVEVRVAAAEQAAALKRRAGEIEEAQKGAHAKGTPAPGDEQLGAVYAKLDGAAGRVKNSFQNAYTFYMSAVVREMVNDPGGAYIDYKKAAEIMPANPFVRSDVLRLAAELGMSEEFARFRAQWPNTHPNRLSAGEGELVVLFEDGFLPPRREFSLFIPLFNSGGWTAIALPVYEGPWEVAHPLAVEVEGGPGKDTALVCDLSALSARALRERMPAILTRQILRATAKAMAPQLARNGGNQDALVIIMSLYAMITERADLRSWNTLPQNAQVMRMGIVPGRHVLTLTHRGTGARAVCEVEVRPGGRTFVKAVRTGGRLSACSVAYGR